jgi:hypothetical protein
MNGKVKLVLICFMAPCCLLERSKVLTSSSLFHNIDGAGSLQESGLQRQQAIKQ